MQRLRVTLGSIAVTIVMLVLLSTIVLWNEETRLEQSEIAVFTPKEKRVHLDNEHLVDQLASISQQLSLNRVTWDEQGKLSLDIRVAASVHRAVSLDQVQFPRNRQCESASVAHCH